MDWPETVWTECIELNGRELDWMDELAMRESGQIREWTGDGRPDQSGLPGCGLELDVDCRLQLQLQRLLLLKCCMCLSISSVRSTYTYCRLDCPYVHVPATIPS